MPPYFEHIELASGIHHVIWLDNSTESAEAYQELLTQVLKDFPEENTPTLRILHDYREVSFHPFLQVLGSIKWISTLYPHVFARIAYLIRDLSLEILMDSMAQMSHNQVKRQLFKPDEEHVAIEWLLSEET